MIDSTIHGVLAMGPGPRRTAAFASWLQGLYEDRSRAPVLVGGAAVELYTKGAYRTGDVDFVGEVPESVRSSLEAAGFERKGRHWIHRESRLFLEFPARGFDADVRIEENRFGPYVVRIVAAEEILVDRLAAWTFWKSAVDGINALLLWWDTGDEMDVDRLRSVAKREDVNEALDAVRKYADRAGEDLPPMEEIEEWARAGPG